VSEEPTAEYHLQKAREREHILVAIVLAQREWRRVIEVVEAAATTSEAQLAIQRAFSMTPHQAMAVMDMQVRRVTAVERDHITEDLAKVRTDIQELEARR
jgi:DNA gyrase subunit A